MSACTACMLATEGSLCAVPACAAAGVMAGSGWPSVPACVAGRWAMFWYPLWGIQHSTSASPGDLDSLTKASKGTHRGQNIGNLRFFVFN